MVQFSASGAVLGSWGFPDGYQGSPNGVAADASGNVFVADYEGNAVHKFTSLGALITSWGSTGGLPGMFRQPVDIAVDGSGDVYVLELLGRRIQKFTNGGAYLTTIGTPGSGPGQFQDSVGIGLDDAGRIYVADAGRVRILRFLPSGAFDMEFAPPGMPTDVAVGPDGNVYVILFETGWARQYSPDGVLLQLFGGGLAGAYRIAIAPDGALYITEQYNTRVSKFQLGHTTGATRTTVGRLKAAFRQGFAPASEPACLPSRARARGRGGIPPSRTRPLPCGHASGHHRPAMALSREEHGRRAAAVRAALVARHPGRPGLGGLRRGARRRHQRQAPAPAADLLRPLRGRARAGRRPAAGRDHAARRDDGLDRFPRDPRPAERAGRPRRLAPGAGTRRGRGRAARHDGGGVARDAPRADGHPAGRAGARHERVHARTAETPGQGNFFDAFPLHLLTRTTLRTLARVAPDPDWDERRFRPNLLIEMDDGDGYPELAWVGRRLRAGGALLQVVTGCPRCVMVTLEGDGLPQDHRVMRTLVRETRHTAGIYASVAGEGEVREGDAIELVE
jgi:sugar lactone lactonase YvrE